MIGIDTTVLLAFEMREIPSHKRVRETVLTLCERRTEHFVLCPQILHEFLHVATDPRRFQHPMPMANTVIRSEAWWTAAEVVHCLPDARATAQFQDWMKAFRLGRQRILDTALASAYHTAGVTRLATANPEDFEVFDVFEFVPWALA